MYPIKNSMTLKTFAVFKKTVCQETERFHNLKNPSFFTDVWRQKRIYSLSEWTLKMYFKIIVNVWRSIMYKRLCLSLQISVKNMQIVLKFLQKKNNCVTRLSSLRKCSLDFPPAWFEWVVQSQLLENFSQVKLENRIQNSKSFIVRKFYSITFEVISGQEN